MDNIDKTISDYLVHARKRHLRETNQVELDDAAFVRTVLEIAALIGALPKPDWPPKPQAKPPASVPSIRPVEDKTCVQCHRDADRTALWRPNRVAPAVYLHDGCIIPYADEWHRRAYAAKHGHSDDAA